MKFYKRLLLILLFVALMVLVAIDVPNVMASDSINPTKTYIKTLQLSNNQIVVNWKTIDNCSGYEIQYSQNDQFDEFQQILVQDTASDRTSVTGITPGIYYFRIRTIKTINETNYYSDWSNIKNINFKFEKTYLMKQCTESNVISVAWKNVNCHSYEIQCSQSDSFDKYYTFVFAQKKTSNDRLENELNDDSLIPGTYYLRIRAVYKVNGKSYRSEWSNIKTADYKLDKTYIKTITSIDNRIDMNWKTIENCDGYNIQYSILPNMDNATDVYIPDCEFDFYSMGYMLPPSNYYVRIRTYKEYNGVNYYSEWSNIKNVQYNLVKTYLINPYVKNGKVFVSWKPFNCDGYQIQIASNSSFTSNKTSVIVNGGENSKCELSPVTGANYLRIRTYKVIGNIRYYSAWSNTKIAPLVTNGTNITSLYNQCNSVSINWDKNISISGYDIQYSQDQSFVTGVHNIEIQSKDTTKYSITLEPGLYYFRIRTYEMINQSKLCSSWSTYKQINFQLNGTNFTNIQRIDDKLNLEWGISKGCHGYQIQISSDETFSENLKTVSIWNTDTLNAIIERIDSGDLYVRIRTHKTINNQRYYSDWSKIEKINET